jgi:hypothetical protein
MSNPWSQIEKPAADFNVRLVKDDHPLKLYWGLDPQGQYLFVYDSVVEGVPTKKSLPKLVGVRATIFEAGNSKKLVLVLNERENWELFRALCMDLVYATSQAKDGSSAASSIVLRRLTRWQEFLQKERLGILPLEKIKGLMGELLFLENQVAPGFGWADAVLFWKGPEGAPQDFAVHDTAIEVKCQSGGTRPTVRISSAEQLDPQLSEGFLVVYTLATASADDSTGFDLNELTDRLRKNLDMETDSARERYEDLLYQAGYVASDRYADYRFSVIAVQSFRLCEEFPRFIVTDVPAGVEKLGYSLRLDACAPFSGTPKWWKE